MIFHYLKEQVTYGKIHLKHCKSENQIADIMIKVVQVELFKRLKSMMNVESLDTMN